MIPQGPRLPYAAEARFFPDHHSFALPNLRKLASFHLLRAEMLISCKGWRLLVFMGFDDGNWRLPGSRRGPRPATTFYPRRLSKPYAPDAVCVRDAFGKPAVETNPSFLRRVELVPGVGPVVSPVPTSSSHSSSGGSPFENVVSRGFDALRRVHTKLGVY